MDPRHHDRQLIDWLMRAYVGTTEIHEVSRAPDPMDPDPIAERTFVALNEHARDPRRLPLDMLACDLWIVPPDVWGAIRRGEVAAAEGFGGLPIRHWTRLPEHDDTSTRACSLTLKNFRRFEQTSLTFRSGINVLIGPNGAGKTTILDALAMSLSGAVHPLHPNFGEAFSGSGVRTPDIRVARIDKGGITTMERQLPARIHTDMLLLGEPFQTGPHAERLDSGATVTGPGRAITFVELTDFVRAAVQDGFDVTLPLIAYYGPRRVWRDSGQRSPERDDLSRLAGYEGCLEPSTHLAGMRGWFRRMELLALQEGRIPPVLEASKRAILACLDGFDLVRYDARLDDLAARTTEGGLILGFEQLSDGQRNMLGMVADMAYRSCTLNPHLGARAAEKTPGVVLIDELDLHLHPAWQRRVVDDLCRTFPEVQFIVTTHSPQVLGEVPSESVLLLDDSQASSVPAPVEGRDTGSILWEVLGVTAHPRKTVEELGVIADLLDEGDYGHARERLDLLARKLTERDPEVARLRALLDVTERIDASDQEGS